MKTMSVKKNWVKPSLDVTTVRTAQGGSYHSQDQTNGAVFQHHS